MPTSAPNLKTRPFAARLRRALAFGVLASTSAACGGSSGANDVNHPVSDYAGHLADVFDDTIEPAAVGLDFDKGYAPRSDKILRERTQIGDAVVRVRIATVTAKTDGPDATYQLGLHTLEKLAGKHPPPADFTVHVDRTSGSHGILKNFESRLVGCAFVAFVREFVRPSGDFEVHFHLAPDTKEVKAAVGDALILGDLE